MRRGSEMTSEPTRRANTVPTRGAESSDPWLVDDSNSPYMKGRVWVWRSATDGEHSNLNGPGLIVPDRFDLTAGLEPDAGRAADDGPGRDEPAAYASAWRANRLWLVLSVVAGIVTGGSFLMIAWVMHIIAAHPVAIITTAVGGVMLLVASPAWVFVDTWLEARQLSKLRAMPDPSAE